MELGTLKAANAKVKNRRVLSNMKVVVEAVASVATDSGGHQQGLMVEVVVVVGWWWSDPCLGAVSGEAGICVAG